MVGPDWDGVLTNPNTDGDVGRSVEGERGGETVNEDVGVGLCGAH